MFEDQFPDRTKIDPFNRRGAPMRIGWIDQSFYSGSPGRRILRWARMQRFCLPQARLDSRPGITALFDEIARGSCILEMVFDQLVAGFGQSTIHQCTQFQIGFRFSVC